MVKSIQDINDKYDYVDEYPNGKGDRNKVACGQSGSYNELQHIYDTHLEPEVKARNITKQQAIDALDSACSNVKKPRNREDFYDHLTSELGIDI